MKTSDIEGLANSGQVANAGFDLGKTLRQVVIPKFLLDIDMVAGKVSWRRKTQSFSFVNGTRNYNLPSDFARGDALIPYDSGNNELAELRYLGEDALQIARSETETTAARPTGYYLLWSATPKLRLNTNPDASYTAIMVYYWRIVFTNNHTAVDLDAYIPVDMQGGLVPALRAEIFEDAYGSGDKRALTEREKYASWLQALAGRPEQMARVQVITVA